MEANQYAQASVPKEYLQGGQIVGRVEPPRPQRESAQADLNRLISKLSSAINALDTIRPHGPEMAMAQKTAEPGLLDSIDQAHNLAAILDRHAHEIAELVGRL